MKGKQICPKCGLINDDNAKYCEKCGVPLNESVTHAVNRTKSIIIIGLCVILLSGLAFGVLIES